MSKRSWVAKKLTFDKIGSKMEVFRQNDGLNFKFSLQDLLKAHNSPYWRILCKHPFRGAGCSLFESPSTKRR